MKILWSTNDQIGARLIRLGYGDDCSHLAVAFGQTVYEARLEAGVVSCSMGNFLSRNRLVHSLETGWSPMEDSAAEKIIRLKRGSRYDGKALAWLAICAIGRRLFNLGDPTHNQWADKKQYICVELLEGLQGMLGISKLDLAIERPHTVWEILAKRWDLLNE